MSEVTNQKPVVHFVGMPAFYSDSHPDYGDYEYARVYALDHPLLGRDSIRTSVIVKKDGDGIDGFETLNTIYTRFKEYERDL